MNPNDVLLKVDGLTVEFRGVNGWVRVVEDVSFQVHAGQIVGLVGESGSGKSVCALALVRGHVKVLAGGQEKSSRW